ncbi:hypothetical protein HYR69_08515 [Candidatus Sumerlaeota bacterium]|nr:hypothetical protein [Candidatus Sumerlaeota bacterium]MBI3735680.1 hypothetical protein [Candidatus Sumerlaeota bacterium]
MQRNPPLFFRPLIFKLHLLAAVCVLAPLGGCRHNPNSIEIDNRFSYNVARVPSWYPPQAKVSFRRKTASFLTFGLVSAAPPAVSPLTPAEQDVMDRMGRPDFIHFWWTPDGTFITSSDLAGKNLDIGEELKLTKRTWVYLKDKSEIEFHNDGSRYDVHPLTPKLELICTYGDPTQKTPPKPDKGGRMHETWEWLEHGLRIEFVDGVELKREFFHGTGRGTYLMK